jgi:NADH-quinone oxidoreductase subunit E
MPRATTAEPRPETRTEDSSASIAKLIADHAGKPGALLGVLEGAQELERFKYLPEAALRQIADGLGVPLSQVYSVATFYSFFNLVPQGLHSVVVCRGTACHTRGSLELLQSALRKLGIPDFREDETNSATTADHFCSVRTVACFGQCALAPVVQIDGVIYSRMTVGKLVAAIDKMAKGGRK